MKTRIPTAWFGCRTFILLIVCALAWPVGRADAQATTGVITGVVTNVDGQPVAGAIVIARHLPSGSSYEATTGADGRYSIPGMRVGGPYSVTVIFSLTGVAAFAPETADSVMVNLGIATDVPITVKPITVAELQARMKIRDAHQLYQSHEWGRAAAKYEETLALEPSTSGYAAYFFLGNSYDNMYAPAKKGDPTNDALLTKAVDNYKKAAELLTDPKIKNLAMQYLVAACGPDKLNDPSQAEPILQRMIQMDPSEPTNYFQLSKIYSDSGDLDNAEAALKKAREVKPSDPAVYMQLAGFYASQGDFPKTIEAVEARAAQDPKNPEAYYTIATYYWDKAFRDFKVQPPEKMKYIQSGIDACDKALALDKDYIEAMTYKNLLLRLEANLEKNPGRQQELLKEADQLKDRVEELRKQKTPPPDSSGVRSPAFG